MEDKGKKLCFIIPSLQAGGMERVMTELIGYFSTKSDIEMHLLLYGITREIFYKVPENIIIHKPPFSFYNSFRWFHAIKTMLFIRETVKSIDPFSILSFGEYWNNFVLVAIYGLKHPIYVSDRCQPDKSLGNFHDWLRMRLYLKAAGIITQTEKAAEIYKEKYRFSKISIIGNPIRTITKRKEVSRGNIVLMVGRFIKTKHQDKLIEIFLEIRKPEWKLVIVGYDHLKQSMSEKFIKIIAEAHAENEVILAGKQTDVESYYLRSSIFAFTSSSEGFPNAIGEAMAAELPVVAFDCIAGPSELIRDGWNGFLVPLFDYDQFKNRLEQLMDNESLRITLGGRARVSIKKYSVKKIGDQYLKLLLGVKYNIN
jgi:GalNAc-alpha-(1->4)-GalNAc-alpha-(1->3)-diNAcBac-PP-undecaprenol alpha-1,4-N-acetyl-D-galactosaminyltransferase